MVRKSIMALTLGLVMSTQAFAFGNTDHWEKETDKGFQEAIILDASGASLLLSCSDDDVAVVRFTDANGKSVENETDAVMSFWFDDDDEPGDEMTLGTTDWRNGANDFYKLLDKFRNNQNVHVESEGLEPADFTLKGSTKSVPTNCNSAF